MAQIPEELKGMILAGGAKRMARMTWILGPLAVVCMIVGIIGDATNTVPGLEPTNWFLMAVSFCIWCFGAWATAYAAAKEGEK